MFIVFCFVKPHCFRYSLIESHYRLAALNAHQNDLHFKFSTTRSVMAQKTALFIVAEGSEELEIVAPVDILRRANVILIVVK